MVHVEAKSSTSSSGNPGEILPRRGWVVCGGDKGEGGAEFTSQPPGTS